MRNYILSFMQNFDYPTEAQETILSSYDKIIKTDSANEIFHNQVNLYNEDKLTDYSKALELLDEVSKLSGVHEYTVDLLFFICLSEHLKYIYAKKNISDSIYHDSMSDLKWKLFECHNMYHIWGTFVASWFHGFFELTHFALGRLQYELIEFDRTYSKSGNTLNKGDLVLHMHIPSCGPLLHEDCMKSFELAADFFKDYFVGRPAAFHCLSWIMFPKHKEFLNPSSNIVKFMNYFDIIDMVIDENYSDLWRIFNKEYHGNIDDLPSDTSLQRNYKEWISKGNKVGYGIGVFFFDGKKIL